MTFWSSEDDAGGEDLAAWLASIGGEGADGEFAVTGDIGSFGGVFDVADGPIGFGDAGQESAS